MDPPPGANNPSKRRRLDEELPREIPRPNAPRGHQADYGYNTLPIAGGSQQPWVLPQPDDGAKWAVNPTMFSHSLDGMSPYRSFSSQGATGSLIQDNGYQFALGSPQRLSNTLVPSSFNQWQPTYPMAQEPAQTTKEEYVDKVCFGMVSQANNVAHSWILT